MFEVGDIVVWYFGEEFTIYEVSEKIDGFYILSKIFDTADSSILQEEAKFYEDELDRFNIFKLDFDFLEVGGDLKRIFNECTI